MLGNGNTVVVELAEALAAVVPVDEPHFLFAADGAVAVEQALKIAFQYWVNQGVDGPHGVPRPRRRLPRRHHRLALARRRRRVQRRVRAAVLPGRAHARLRRPRLGRQGLRRHRGPRRRAGRRRARAARPGGGGDAVRLRAPTCGGSARRAARPACSSSATRWRPGSGGPARSSPPSSAACGPTCSASARGSPAATWPCRPRSPRARSSTRSSGADLGPADLLPRALLRRERPGRRRGARAPAPHGVLGRARQRAGPGGPARRPARRPGRRPAVGARDPPARPHGRRRAGPAGAGPALGPPGLRGCRLDGACCCARSATSSCSCRRSPSPRTRSSGWSTRCAGRSTR